jgi:hypothetical protein
MAALSDDDINICPRRLVSSEIALLLSWTEKLLIIENQFELRTYNLYRTLKANHGRAL